MRHRLVETSDELFIGNSVTSINEDGECVRQVIKPKKYQGVTLLLDDNSRPVFHANAFLMSRRIVDDIQDAVDPAKALLLYFRFLSANNMTWNDFDTSYDRAPIFLFRNHLNKLVSEGFYKKRTAAKYLGTVRKFYAFCYRHRYIEQLPYIIEGLNKYGHNYTNCTIQAGDVSSSLKPLNDRELHYVREHWNIVSLEFRLLILLSLHSGLRAIEASDIKKRLFVIPKNFGGKTVTGIQIGASNNCKTKFDVDREISMPVWLIELFNQYHQTDKYKQKASEYYQMTGDDDIPALLTKNSVTFPVTTITALWNRITQAIRNNSDPHFKHKFHDTRATFGCKKIDALLNVKYITSGQALAILKAEMGHKQIGSTLRYLAYWEGNPDLNAASEIMMDFDDIALDGVDD